MHVGGCQGISSLFVVLPRCDGLTSYCIPSLRLTCYDNGIARTVSSSNLLVLCRAQLWPSPACQGAGARWAWLVVRGEARGMRLGMSRGVVAETRSKLAERTRTTHPRMLPPLNRYRYE